MKPWFERRPELLAREEEAVASTYMNLYFVVADGVVRVRGNLPVRVGPTVVDLFQLEVRLADDHPAAYPIAREVGGRIAWLPAHHVNDDGQLCLFLPEEASEYWAPGSTVCSFLEGPLNSYFVGYLHYLEFGAWPFGERRHGLDGALDFYRGRSEIATLEGLLGLVAMLARRGVKGHLPCPCGSGKPIRSCHPKALQLREGVSPRVAAATLQRIVDATKGGHNARGTKWGQSFEMVLLTGPAVP